MALIYEPEDELVVKLINNEITNIYFIRHHSYRLRKEYSEYCKTNNLDEKEEASADAFLKWRDDLPFESGYIG